MSSRLVRQFLFCQLLPGILEHTLPVSVLEVDVGSPMPINRGQFGVDGDEDGLMIAGQ